MAAFVIVDILETTDNQKMEQTEPASSQPYRSTAAATSRSVGRSRSRKANGGRRFR